MQMQITMDVHSEGKSANGSYNIDIWDNHLSINGSGPVSLNVDLAKNGSEKLVRAAIDIMFSDLYAVIKKYADHSETYKRL